MPNFTISVPTTDLNDLVSAFSEGWDSSMAETKTQYAKKQIMQYIRSQVKSYRERQQNILEPNIEVT